MRGLSKDTCIFGGGQICVQSKKSVECSDGWRVKREQMVGENSERRPYDLSCGPQKRTTSGGSDGVKIASSCVCVEKTQSG